MNRMLVVSVFTGLFSLFTKIFPPFVFSLSLPLYFLIKRREFYLLLFNTVILLLFLTKIFSLYEFFIYLGLIIAFLISITFSRKKDFFNVLSSSIFSVFLWLTLILFISLIFLEKNLSSFLSFKFSKLLLLSFLNEILNIKNPDIVISRFYFLKDTLPAFIFIGVFFGIVISFYLREKMERFFKIKGISLPALSEWKIEKNFIWVFITSGIIFFTGFYLNNRTFLVVGENMAVVSLFIYFISGIGILDFYFKKNSIPVFLRFPLYVLCIFFYPLPIMLGITETWYKMR